MTDISSALISWIKIPGIIDEDTTSFRDIVNIDDFIQTFEKLFYKQFEGETNKKLMQIINYLKDNIPKEFHDDNRIPEVDIDNLEECDFIELENATQLCLYAKYGDKEHPNEFKEMLDQLNDYDKDEINNLLSVTGRQSQADLLMLVARVRAYSKAYTEFLSDQDELNKLNETIDDPSGSKLVQEEEQKMAKSLEEQKDKIKALEKEIDDLKTQKKAKREENDKFEANMNTDFKLLIDTEQKKGEELEHEINVIKKELESMPELTKEIQKLEEEEKLAKEDLKEKRKEKEEIEKRVFAKKEEMEEKRKELDTILETRQKQKKEIEGKVEQSKIQLEQRKKELEELKTSPAVSAAIVKLQNARKERDEKKEEIKGIIKEMQEIKEQLSTGL